MVLARRLDRLEADLDPLGAVLRWLDEAHGYPTLEAYTDSWSGTEHPMLRVSEQVEATVRRRLKGQRSQDVERAVRRADHAAAFRVELVVMVNLEAMDLLRVQGLVYVAQVYRLRELSCRELLADDVDGGRDRESLARDRVAWIEVSRQLIGLLAAKRKAFEDLERRYLGGHAALFPGTARELGELVASVDGLIAFMVELGAIEETPAVAEKPDAGA